MGLIAAGGRGLREVVVIAGSRPIRAGRPLAWASTAARSPRTTHAPGAHAAAKSQRPGRAGRAPAPTPTGTLRQRCHQRRVRGRRAHLPVFLPSSGAKPFGAVAYLGADAVGVILSGMRTEGLSPAPRGSSGDW